MQLYKGITNYYILQSLKTTIYTWVLFQMDEEKNHVYVLIFFVLINLYTKITLFRYFCKANMEKIEMTSIQTSRFKEPFQKVSISGEFNESIICRKKVWFFFVKNQPTKNSLSQSFYLISIMSKSGVSNLRKSLEIEFQIISCRI